MIHQHKNILMLLSNAFDPDPRVQREASALVQSGSQVTIICWDRDLKSAPSDCIDGIYVERIRIASTHGRGIGQSFYLVLFWLRAFFRALRKPFDIIHAHDFDTLPLGYILSKCKKAKLIYDAHESYVGMVHNLPQLFKRLIYNAETWILKRTDLAITVGDILRTHLVQRGATRTAVIGNWQDPDLFRFDNGDLDNVRRRLQIRDDKAVICYIAHLGYERQVPQLIEAVRRSPMIR